MARCLPFPPPRFVLNGVSGEALLELMKVRRENAAAEKRRKEEKRRRKKQKKEWGEGEISKNKSRHKHKKIKKCWDTDQSLDRSNLTEEIDRSVSDSLCESSDNTENIKGKEHCSSINGCCKYGRITRVDLQPLEDKDPLALSSIPVRTHKLLQHSSARRPDAISDGKAETNSISIFSESCTSTVELQYKELILNWVPPPIKIENSEFDEQEWIFERKLLGRSTTDKSTACHNDLHYGRCYLYPAAQYLQQDDIYSLPYTVLF